VPVLRKGANLSKRAPVDLWREAGFLQIGARLLLIVIYVQYVNLRERNGGNAEPENENAENESDDAQRFFPLRDQRREKLPFCFFTQRKWRSCASLQCLAKRGFAKREAANG
jgi:hypothetical protein